MDEYVEASTVPYVLPEGASGAHDDMNEDVSDHHYENVGKMDEAVETASVTDQQN